MAFRGAKRNGRTTLDEVAVRGDMLNPDISRYLEQAIRDYPGARLIIGEHDMAGESDRMRGRTLNKTQLAEPVHALRLAAEGNWFGSLLAHFIHRDAVTRGFDFGDLPWSADFRLCLDIAVEFPVLSLVECSRMHRDVPQTESALLHDLCEQLAYGCRTNRGSGRGGPPL